MPAIEQGERLLVTLSGAPQQNVVPVLLGNTHLSWSGVRGRHPLPCALIYFPIARKKVPARPVLCGVQIIGMYRWTFAVAGACQRRFLSGVFKLACLPVDGTLGWRVFR